MNQKRLNLLHNKLIDNELDALLVTKKENVFYLTDFYGEGILLITSKNKHHLLTDSRFAEEASSLKHKEFKIDIVSDSFVKSLKNIAKKEKVKRLGFESEWLSYQGVRRFSTGLKSIKLVPKKNLIENIRIIKDDYELDYITKSISIIKKAHLYIKNKITSGVTEEGLSIKIDSFMRSHGAEEIAFRTIVASGVNSSRPHAISSSKKLSKGEVVLVDMGCVYKGYYSDLTRMFFLGKISDTLKSVYTIVKTAQNKALKIIKPGVKISTIDNEARQHIIAKGFGKNFIHSLGHGIGLEIHEQPVISKKDTSLLKPGMVFTVEPGIYIPGLGGVRLEDMVLVTKTGCEILTKGIPK